MPSVSRRFVSKPEGRSYFPHYYLGRITLFDPVEGKGGPPHDPYMGWKGLATEVETHTVPGNRSAMFWEPGVLVLADKLNACLKPDS